MLFSKSALEPVRWLAAETLVVVLGILIAFQVDAWRAEAADRQLEARFLEELRADLDSDARQLERGIAQRREQIPVLRELIARLADPATTQADGPELFALEEAYRGGMTLYRPVRTTLDSMIGSGSLSLIDDRALSRSVVEYYRLPGMTISEARLRELVQEDIGAFTRRTHGALYFIQQFETDFGRERLFGVPEEEAPVVPDFDVEAHRSDPAYQDLLGIAYLQQAYHELRYREQLDRNRVLRDAIDARLEQIR